MEKFKYWIRTHQGEILWFVMGWLVTSGIRSLLMGDFVSAGLSFFFAFLNYSLSR